jgi:hypothetical protein
MRNLLLFLVLLASSACREIPKLKPMIGGTERPQPTDSICPTPIFLPTDVREAGFQVNDTVSDFCLQSLEGEEFHLSEHLAGKKPVLLVNTSYTCPIWRKLASLPDSIAARYKDTLEVYLVYTLEAHPDGETCPLTGNSWTPNENFEDSIFLRQPKTYGERLAVARDMVDALGIKVSVLVDEPCNAWWMNYGPAANTAYLIRPDGTVAARHFGFQYKGEDIWTDIEKLLAPRRS